MKTLKSFSTTILTSKISLRAQLRKISSLDLEVDFEFQGAVDSILWPANSAPERKDELWKTTCLEVFLSKSTDPEKPYIEINCSPAGEWNAYSFGSYRKSMQPVSDIVVRLKEGKKSADGASFTLLVSSKVPLPTEVFSLTAVLEFTNHEKSYWALSHSEDVPNFHAKAAWIDASTR